MRVVGRLGRQHQLGKRGQLDRPVGRPLVDQRDAASLAVAFRHHDALDFGAQRVDGLDEARLVVGKMRLAVFAGNRLGLDRRRPPLVRVGVAQEQVAAQPVLGRVGMPARHGEIVPAAVAGAGRRHHHRVVAVRHQAGRAQRLGRVEHQARVLADLDLVAVDAVVGIGAHRRHRNVARRLFLQQQFGGFDHRVAVEAVAHAALEHGIGHRRRSTCPGDAPCSSAPPPGCCLPARAAA